MWFAEQRVDPIVDKLAHDIECPKLAAHCLMQNASSASRPLVLIDDRRPFSAVEAYDSPMAALERPTALKRVALPVFAPNRYPSING